MSTEPLQVPPGPAEKYDPSQDLLRWIRDNFGRFGDIYKASIYGAEVYVVSDPQHAQYVLRDNWQNYKKGQAIKRIGLLLGNGLMLSEGEFWKSQRRLIQPSFHYEAIDALTSVIIASNAALLEQWEQAAERKNTVNLTRDTSLMVLKVVLLSIFGDDYETVASPFSILSSESKRDLQFAQQFRALGKIVIQIAHQRQTAGTISKDILGMLMEAKDRDTDEVMPDRQLVSEIMTLIVAGHETTASTLNWTWYLLAKNTEAEEKLSRELFNSEGTAHSGLGDLRKCSYSRQVIEEAMRLYPPGWLMTRKALKDDRIGKYLVPAGTEIYISPYLIQRHPAIWEDPDCFNPDRFAPERSRSRNDSAMLPFSAGPRKCIGESLARLEMQIHLVMIAKRLRLRCVEEIPLELDAGVNLRSKHDFIMAPETKTLAFRPAASGPDQT